MSARSSIYNYVEEAGGTYHRYKNGCMFGGMILAIDLVLTRYVSSVYLAKRGSE